MNTPRARYREAATEMAVFEYDEEYYDENPRRKEFDELSLDVNRRLSFTMQRVSEVK